MARLPAGENLANKLRPNDPVKRGVVCAASYAAGVMADRANRKALLGVGLLGNALAITAMGLTRQYELIMLCGILAPSAT